MTPAAENVLIRKTASRLHRKHCGKLLLMSLLGAGLCLTMLVFGTFVLIAATGGPWMSTAHSVNATGINRPYCIGLWALLLLIVLVGGGLLQGLISTMLRLCRSDDALKQGHIFSRMRYSPRAFGLSLWCSAAILLWIVPGMMLMMGSYLFWAVSIDSHTGVLMLSSQEQQLVGAVLLCGLALCVGLALPVVFRHMLAPVIMADEPSAGIWDCAARSKVMMKGRKWQLFRLLLPILLVLTCVLLALSALGDLGLRTFHDDLTAGLISTLQPVLCLCATLLFSVRALLCLCLFYLLRKNTHHTSWTSAASSAAQTLKKQRRSTMKNLSVENIYTRQSAKTLAKKNIWRLLGMMLLTGLIIIGFCCGGMYLLTQLTDTQWLTIMQTDFTTAALNPNAMIPPTFIYGYIALTLIYTLLATGLNLGLLRSMTDIARSDAKVPVGRVFSRMKYFLKGIGLSIWVGFKTLLWALPGLVIIFLVTGSILAAGDPETMQVTEATAPLLALLPLLMFMLILALVLPATLRYYLSTYVLADEPSTGVFECVRKSKAMMKGHKWQLFKLPIPYLLKMYGWLFLIAIVLAAVMDIVRQVQSQAATIAVIVIMVIGYAFFLVKMVAYVLRSNMAFCVFYLKRKGEMPAVPPEEEERIVAWQPAAEKTAPESVATDAANIGCWNPGGEVKPEKE